MRFKFVHASDLHLDSPMRGLSPGGQPHAVSGGPTFRAFERIVTLCLQEQVQFLLLAGDLYDAQDRSVRARLFLHRQLLRLHDAGIRTYIVHGNHDPLRHDDALALPPSVKVFGSAWEEALIAGREDKVYCRVQGVSYAEERVTENLSARFRRVGEEFTIGLLHANLGATQGHANYAPCSLEDLAACGLDYWALGHVHTRAEHRLSSGGWAVYPGNPQGRHVNEPGARGCLLVTVDERKVSTRFVATHVVQWERIQVDLGALETLDALVGAIDERVADQCRRLEGAEGLAVRLVLVGRGPLHAELLRAGRTVELEEALRELWSHRAPTLFLESVQDQSQPELDLERVLTGGGLAGALGEVWRSQAAGRLMEELFEEDELRRMESALYRQGIESPRSEGEALLEQAALRALDLLVDAGGP